MSDSHPSNHNERGEQEPRRPRGFAALDADRRREIASRGGRAAHASGHAHQFTSDEARAAGRRRHELANRNLMRWDAPDERA